MNNNASPSPGLSQLPSSSSSLHHLPPLLPPTTTRGSVVGTPQSVNSGISALSELSGERSISGLLVSGHGTLLRGQQQHIAPPNLLPQSQHYFRPIIPHHQSSHVHHRHYAGRAHDDFDLTSDSDASSSIIGPPPPLPPLLPGGIGRPPSDHHLTPRLPSIYNGEPPPAIPPNPPGSGKPQIKSKKVLTQSKSLMSPISPFPFRRLRFCESLYRDSVLRSLSSER